MRVSVLDHLSFSSLQRLRECPLKFKWSAEGKTPEREFEIAQKGKEIHAILEEWGRGNDEIIHTLPPKLQKSVERALSDYRPAETEVEINVEIAGIPFVGYIDWLHIRNENGKLVLTVIDHKTGGYGKDVSNKEKKQLITYLGLISKIYKFDVGRIGIHRVNLGKLLWVNTNGVSTEPYEFSHQDALEFYRELEAEVSILGEQAESILSSDSVEPTPGIGCQYCPFIFSCPVSYVPGDPSDILAGAYIVTHERAKTLKAEIEKYGQIRLNNTVVGLSEYLGNVVDNDKVLDVLELIKNGELIPEDTAEFLQFKSQKTHTKKFRTNIEAKIGPVVSKVAKKKFDIKEAVDET